MTTLILTELKRNFRHLGFWIFSILMPVGFYIAFGGLMSYAKESISGTGANVSGYIMVQMAFYAAVLTSTTLGAQTASQRSSGWYRTLMLTPLTSAHFTLSRIVVTSVAALISVTAVYLTGMLSFAILLPEDWITTYLLAIVLSVPFSMLGQICGSLFSEDTAQGVASGLIVMFAFMSDLFMPLSGTLLTVARFMPLFGAKTLVLWPLAEGTNAAQLTVSVWEALAGWGIWTILFVLLGTLLLRRGRERN